MPSCVTNPVNGSSAGTLIASGAAGWDAPRGLLFRNGYVYVTSVGASTPEPGMDSVLRFDAVTGAPAGVSGLPGDAVFISSGSGGLDNPSRMVFGPDGKAYVASTSSASNAILRYDGTTGAFLDTFVPSRQRRAGRPDRDGLPARWLPVRDQLAE